MVATDETILETKPGGERRRRGNVSPRSSDSSVLDHFVSLSLRGENRLGYRITESYPQGGNPDLGSNSADIGTGSIAAGTVNYIYYDSQWQAIETRTNGTANSNVTSQMVWSAAYTNAAVLQDTYSGGVIQPNSRIYYLQDANWNTTAVVGFINATWQVLERYFNSPYGSVTILNADWSTPPAGTPPMANNLYQGMTLDSVTGLYYARNRNYDPSLGRWINQDPAGYINGANTYQFVMSNPVGKVDPSGRSTASIIGSLTSGSGWPPPPPLYQQYQQDQTLANYWFGQTLKILPTDPEYAKAWQQWSKYQNASNNLLGQISSQLEQGLGGQCPNPSGGNGPNWDKVANWAQGIGLGLTFLNVDLEILVPLAL